MPGACLAPLHRILYVRIHLWPPIGISGILQGEVISQVVWVNGCNGFTHPILWYDELSAERDQLLVRPSLVDQLHLVDLLGIGAEVSAPGSLSDGLDESLVRQVAAGRGQQ